MSSQTLDRTSLHRPYTFISTQGYIDASYRSEDETAASESVDLLQMVPDRGSCDQSMGSIDQRKGSRDSLSSKVHCTTSMTGGSPSRPSVQSGSPTRPSIHRMVLLPSDTEGEGDDSTNPLFHTCDHSCSRHDIYYSSVPANPAPVPNAYGDSVYTRRSDGTKASRRVVDDGSVYFNYLQLNKQRNRAGAAYGSHPSLYSHHKHVNCGEASKEYFKCCKKNTNLRSNSTSKLYSHFTKSFKRKLNSGVASDSMLENTTYGTTTQNKLKKRREWTRIKRLMFLVGILIGIVIALGGLVIGFLVLTPKHTELTTECPDGYIFCANTGCVIKGEICSHHHITCPNLDMQQLCGSNSSSTTTKPEVFLFDDSKRKTIKPSVPKPVKDNDGWVLYDKGSPNGSKYITIDKKLPFHAAQEECRKRGGHLAHVNTAREQVFLEDFLISEIKDEGTDTSGFWIGARRSRGSHSGTCMYKQWKWQDAYGRTKGEVSGFTAFVPGKPDNHYKPEECLYMATDQGDDEYSYLKWDDIACDIQTIGQIKILCEMENR